MQLLVGAAARRRFKHTTETRSGRQQDRDQKAKPEGDTDGN
jgi:hypothetical protein